MATLEELSAALVKADAAGNTADAKVLADAIRSMQGQPKQETFGESYAGQALSGVNEGIGNMLGAPVDLATLLLNLGGSGINAAFGTELPPIQKPFLGSEQINEMLGAVGSIKPETEDAGKQFLRRTMQDVGSAIPVVGGLGVASKFARPLSTVTRSWTAPVKELTMAAGSGAGAATAQQAFPGNPVAEFLGQLAGGLGTGAALSTARKVITPIPGANAERLKAVETLKREGVDLTAGQQTGNKRLQYFEAEKAGPQIADITEQQAEQFTQAALKRVGVAAKRATPEVMDQAFSRIGAEFDDLAARNVVQADQQMANDLRGVWQDYTSLVPKSDRKPVVENLLVDIADAIRKGNGRISGEAYKALRSRVERFARGSRDPELADALRGIKGALDDAMERWIAQNNPDDLGAWQQVRKDYRNMLVLERAAQGGGEDAAMGIISPARLRMAVQSIYGKRSYVRGKDEFSELAQSGQAAMTPLPQSGTAPRMKAGAKNVLNPLNWIDEGLGAAAVSPVGRKYLANRLLPKSKNKSGAGVGGAIVSDQTSGDNTRLTPSQRKLLELIMPLEITVPYGP